MGFLSKSISRLCGSSKANSSEHHHQQHHDLPEGIIGRRFSLADIKRATGNFDPNLLIRENIHRKVYMGCFDGVAAVAVKRLSSNSPDAIDQFKKDALLLLQIRHPNLVSFLGLCKEKQENIVVYEYMINLSLDKHLYGIRHSRFLSWEQRLTISIGVARGIHYLHTGAKRAIIYGDLKPSNIMLDENFIPKISEFELSFIGPISMSRSGLQRRESRIICTYNYMPPEYLFHGIKTEKVDVYSFGIVLLEVLIGKPIHEIWQELFDKSDDPDNRTIDLDLSQYSPLDMLVSASIEKGKINEIIDPCVRGEIASDSLQVFLKIMQNCLAYEAVQRPSMGEVEAGLQLALRLQERPHAVNYG